MKRKGTCDWWDKPKPKPIEFFPMEAEAVKAMQELSDQIREYAYHRSLYTGIFSNFKGGA